jgi:hypothetical protein
MDPHLFLLSQRFLFVDDDGFDEEAAVFGQHFSEDGVDRLAQVAIYVVWY